MKRYHKNWLWIALVIFIASSIGCKKSEHLEADFTASPNLPESLVTGTPLGDAIMALYEETGTIVYTDTEDPRFTKDLVSSDALQIPGGRIPADSTAALFFINMIQDEFYDLLPEERKILLPRNYYLIKNKTTTGTGYNAYEYDAYVWYNSNADVTVGSLDNEALDTTFLKGSFYYALATVLRNKPENASYFAKFQQLKTDAEVYYWQVYSFEDAYPLGFLSGIQNRIKSDGQDFDLFAAWAATVDPEERDAILNEHSLLREKYLLVTSMFRQEGIPLEVVNAAWQQSALNPKNR